jgi:hypothetical protein
MALSFAQAALSRLCPMALGFSDGCRSRRSGRGASSFRPVADVDLADDPFRLGPGEIDRQEPVGQIRAQHLHAVGKKEGALELTSGNAAVKEVPGLVFGLPAADHELAFLQGDLKLVLGEAGDRKSDAEPFRIALRTGQTLDVVGGYPSPAALATRSSACSISSKPRRNGCPNGD